MPIRLARSVRSATPQLTLRPPRGPAAGWPQAGDVPLALVRGGAGDCCPIAAADGRAFECECSGSNDDSASAGAARGRALPAPSPSSPTSSSLSSVVVLSKPGEIVELSGCACSGDAPAAAAAPAPAAAADADGGRAVKRRRQEPEAAAAVVASVLSPCAPLSIPQSEPLCHLTPLLPRFHSSQSSDGAEAVEQRRMRLMAEVDLLDCFSSSSSSSVSQSSSSTSGEDDAASPSRTVSQQQHPPQRTKHGEDGATSCRAVAAPPRPPGKRACVVTILSADSTPARPPTAQLREVIDVDSLSD